MIRGISYGAPSYRKDEWDRNNRLKLKYYDPDLAMIKELGATHIRVYAQMPGVFYEMCLKYDLQVIQQLPGILPETNFSSLAELTEMKELHKRYIADMAAYPIYAWFPWNDVPYTWYKPYLAGGSKNIANRWGYDVCDNFLKEIVAGIKEVSAIPVMSSNIFNSEEMNMTGDDLGFKHVDIIGINVYLGIKDWTEGIFDLDVLQKQITKLKAAQEKYQKPILICETGFSSYWGEQKQADCLKLQIETALKEFKAVCIFEMADESFKKVIFPHEGMWGLCSEDRQHKKLAWEIVKDLFNNA